MGKSICIAIILIVASSCRFSKGDQYYSSSPGDSLLYTISAKGNGGRISKKAALLKIQHESRGNECIIRYISDSASMQREKSLLLLNISLPEIKEDMLTKGFFGTFTSKQSVSFLLVSYNDFDRFFRKQPADKSGQ